MKYGVERKLYHSDYNDIVELLENELKTQVEVAAIYKVSRERIRQIHKKHGVIPYKILEAQRSLVKKQEQLQKNKAHDAQVKFHCRTCGEPVTFEYSWKRVFCSEFCSDEDRKKRNIVTGICALCDDPFAVTLFANKEKRLFCENKCYFKFREVYRKTAFYTRSKKLRIKSHNQTIRIRNMERLIRNLRGTVYELKDSLKHTNSSVIRLNKKASKRFVKILAQPPTEQQKKSFKESIGVYHREVAKQEEKKIRIKVTGTNSVKKFKVDQCRKCGMVTVGEFAKYQSQIDMTLCIGCDGSESLLVEGSYLQSGLATASPRIK